jgi:hypothetical protein
MAANETLHPASHGHLPSFITAPGETDVLVVVAAVFLLLSALAVIMHHAERFLHGWPMAARQQSVRLDRCRSLALRHV